MKTDLLRILRCPETGSRLRVADARESNGGIENGTLVTEDGSRQYPIVGHIPRFASIENYAKSFGFQWNRFGKTQLDSHAGLTLSRDRLIESLGCRLQDMADKRVLDVGCGAGRFAEVALAAGAEVVALDYSVATDACWANLGPHPRLNVIQGDIYALPFEPGSFDIVYCLGVLQHTPDVKRAFMALPRQLAPNGRLAVDVYAKLLLNALWPKYWLRPFTKRVREDRLFKLVQIMVPWLLPLSNHVGRISVIGRKLRYAIPVANYEGVIPLSDTQLREWAVLDTFDMLSPKHDYPQSAKTVQAWFEEAQLRDIEVFRRGVCIGRGTK